VLAASSVRPEVGAYTEVYAAGAAPAQQFYEDQVRHHQELVSRAEQKLQGTGLKTEARILHGDPRVALVDTARTEGADLIVIGSHGRTGLAKLLLGSVASHVVTHAPCSVMVVKLAKS
jgi:nucleotide-binding universal stress UspA family protein